MDNAIYYNYDKLLSYTKAILFMVIGERGVGKTYGAKKYCINHYIKKKKKFVWIRRYNTDLDEAIGSSTDIKFFKSIKNEIKGNYEITNNDNTKLLIRNNQIIGYGMSLKMAESLKGTEYDDVDTIIFDEFLVGEGGSRYIKNEPMFLLSIIETIARMRPIKVILLGNATSTINPYFEFFKVHLPYNSDFQTFKDGTIVVNYIKNEKYRKMKKESTFGTLVKGTDYEKYAIDNQFVNDNNLFIQKLPKNAKIFFNITINNQFFGVWLKDNNMYISKSYNLNKNIILSFDLESHSDKTIMIKSNSVFFKNVVYHFNNGCLYFENLYIKTLVMDILKKSRKIGW